MARMKSTASDEMDMDEDKLDMDDIDEMRKTR